MTRDAASIYSEYCALVENAAVTKIGRALSEQELRGIRNAGSGMMLEVVERSLDKLSGADLSEMLCKNGATFEDRFESVLKEVVIELGKLLGRQLSDEEVHALRRKSFIPDVVVVTKLTKGPFFRSQREKTFLKLIRAPESAPQG